MVVVTPSAPESARLVTRQATGGTTSSNSSGYDHRWLLFLIPLILFFFALVALIWFILRRRSKQKRRQSVLRNRTLVMEEEKREKEREERRLSRGNSLSSRLSRMTSTKSTRSTTTRGTSQRGKMSSRDGKSEGHSRFGSHSTQSNSTETGGKATREEEMIEVEEEKDAKYRKEDVEQQQQQRGQKDGHERIKLVDGAGPEVDDVEREAESEAAVTNVGGGSRVRIVEDAKQPRPHMSNRKELSVIGETGMGDEEKGSGFMGGEEAAPSKVTRQGSQQSNNGRTSSNSQYTQASSNPFASPTGSNNDFYADSPSTPVTASTDENTKTGTARAASPSPVGGAGLGRKLSGVIRLRQPSPAHHRARSPASPSPNFLHRTDSKASRKSSTKSTRRTESPNTLAGQESAIPISGSWSYTSKAAQWKSVSVDAASPLPTPAVPTPELSYDAPPSVKVHESSGTGVVDESKDNPIGQGDDEIKRENLSPLPSGVQLARKTSTGVAGSRFVESFDD